MHILSGKRTIKQEKDAAVFNVCVIGFGMAVKGFGREMILLPRNEKNR